MILALNAGDAIPIAARILRVADSLRALTSNRPYQKKYSLNEALEVLQHRAGSFFDPKVITAVLETIEEHPYLFHKERASSKDKASKQLV